MALVIYSNGIIEEIIPNENIFSEKELIQSFNEYSEIKTHRLEDIPNCWCVWGFINEPPSNEFNKLASEVVDEDVFSHILFVHDSEINKNWNLTDKITYRPYKKFIESVGSYVSEMSRYIQTENRKEIENIDNNPSMIFLTAKGHTKDKRVLFVFNPNEQNENFYKDGGWDKLCINIYEYLNKNFHKEPIEKDKPFVIFSDTKTIVIVEDEHVNQIIDGIIKRFEKLEKYEICSKIAEIKDQWYSKKSLIQPDTSTGSVDFKQKKPPKKN